MAKHSLPSADGDHRSTQQNPAIYEGYMARRVDVKLPLKHRKILHDKMRQLQDAGAKLEDGTEVSDKTKAVLWILENEVDV